ncbi:MAG: CYTH domain-containing protein [Bacteroides sp.]|nr:CYTH domain-containing protein [Bacteroides sp.]MCM1550204.1 CYTH domain-containing protein [Clostridium sp.]
MEIERKFLIKEIPMPLDCYPALEIEQGYLNTSPVLRIRRRNDAYIFTYKSSGLMSREELEVPLNKEAYLHLLPKCDGNLISKTRYQIPESQGYTIELDVFHGCLEGLVLAEVEFPSEAQAYAFQPPEWFFQEVTQELTFHNSNLAVSEPEAILKAAGIH